MTDALRMGDVVQLREDSQESPIGTLHGYFARFNEPTEINNPMEGHFIERLGPNSFDRTLAEHGRNFQVLFNHGLDSAVGQRPLGVPSVLRVDSGVGVYAEVPLDDTSYNRDLAASLRSGALRGQSFRARWVDSSKPVKGASGLPEVTRNEVALKEFGPVTFPAYSSSTVGIRSGDLLLPSGYKVTTRELLEVDVEDLFPELRSGAVLSNENLALIDQAITHLTTVKNNHLAKANRAEDTSADEVDRAEADTPTDEPASEPAEDGAARAAAVLASLQTQRLRQALAQR
ncbi:MAG: HK97 family phage prohead protease [Blastococcus sp.]